MVFFLLKIGLPVPRGSAPSAHHSSEVLLRYYRDIVLSSTRRALHKGLGRVGKRLRGTPHTSPVLQHGSDSFPSGQRNHLLLNPCVHWASSALRDTFVGTVFTHRQAVSICLWPCCSGEHKLLPRVGPSDLFPLPAA